MDAKWNSFLRVRYANDRVRSGSLVIPREQVLFSGNISPSRVLERIELTGNAGQQIDFENSRPGTGADVNLAATVRATDHLELLLNLGRRWLDVRPAEEADRARLFTAQVERLRATYTFTSRMFVRAIAQYVETERDLTLYLGEPPLAREGSLTSSLLFAYKLNWQTVLFVGFGDGRTLTEGGDLQREDRQVFVKVSYAFQR